MHISGPTSADRPDSPEGPDAHKPSVGRRILGGVLSGAGFAVVTAVVQFIQIPLVLSYLPRDIAGIWFLFLSLGVYIAYFDLGISPTISREISFVLGKDRHEESEKLRMVADLLSTCAAIFRVMAAVVLIAGLAGGWLFLRRVVPGDGSAEVGIAWAVFTFGASVNILGGAAFSALYGLGNVAAERIIKSVALVFGLLLSALSLYLGFGIIGLAAAWVLQNAAARVVALIVLGRYYPWLRHARGKARIDITKKIAVPSLKWAAMGLGAILILYTDNPIIAATLGPSRIPSYEAAIKIVFMLMFLSLLLTTSSSPFFSRAYSAGEMDSFRELLSRNVRFGMSAMVVLASFLSLFGDRVIELWLGGGNFVGYPVLWTLLIVLTLECHHVIHATAVMAAGHVIFLRPAIIAGALKIALSLLLVGRYGLFGVALGTLIAQLLTNNWYAPYAALRLFDIPLREYLRRIVLPLALFFLVMTGVNFGLKSVIYGSAMPSGLALPLSFLVSASFGIIITWFLMATDAERKTIKKLSIV